MKHQMLNGNILTKDITNNEIETEVGFIDTKQNRFKDLEVVISSDESIKKGSIVKVRQTTGENIEIPEGEYIVIQSRDIIMVL